MARPPDTGIPRAELGSFVEQSYSSKQATRNAVKLITRVGQVDRYGCALCVLTFQTVGAVMKHRRRDHRDLIPLTNADRAIAGRQVQQSKAAQPPKRPPGKEINLAEVKPSQPALFGDDPTNQHLDGLAEVFLLQNANRQAAISHARAMQIQRDEAEKVRVGIRSGMINLMEKMFPELKITFKEEETA